MAFLGLTVGTETEPPVRILLAVGIGVGAVYFWVSSKANKRMGMIEEQLPDAVELMVRSCVWVTRSLGDSDRVQRSPGSAGLRIWRHR